MFKLLTLVLQNLEKNSSIINNGITEEEVLSYTKNLIIAQMTQYGQPKPEEEKLSEIAKNVLKNQDEHKKVNEQIFDKKTLNVYKENFKIKEKKIAYNDFIKLASEKQK